MVKPEKIVTSGVEFNNLHLYQNENKTIHCLLICEFLK